MTVEDGTWGLVRASSNKPELVVVVESPASEARMRAMFEAVDRDLAREPRSRRLQPDDLMLDAASDPAHVLPDLLAPGPQDRLLRHGGRKCLGRARRLLRPSAEPLLVGAPRLRPDAAEARAAEDYAELPQWGLGLTDIAKHVSGMDRELPAGALGRDACAALAAKIAAAEPEWLAFTSLTAGRRYLGRAAGFGEQPERIGRTRLWLLPSPIPDRGLELGAQHALVAKARGRGALQGSSLPQVKPRVFVPAQPVDISGDKRQ